MEVTPEDYPRMAPTNQTPLFKYHHVLEIAKMLGITPLIENISHRYEALTTYEGGKSFKIDPADVKKVYEEGLGVDHALRKELVDIVAQAWKQNNFWKAKRNAFEAMWCENEAFRSDMEARGCVW